MMSDNREIVVYVLSDSLGETALNVVRAAASQFPKHNIIYKQIPYVENIDYLRDVLEKIDPDRSILMFTVVLKEVCEQIYNYCHELNIRYVDILKDPFEQISSLTQTEPVGIPGIVRKMDDEYFKKIEAIEFAIKYDDGKDTSGVRLADLVLLGVSRTSKTPLSMYLAYRGIKVVNIPLVPHVHLGDEIYSVPKDRVIGLTIRPEVLEDIRKERLRSMGVMGYSEYNDMSKILDELDYAEKIMKRIGCPIIDVSHKAVEETANTVLQIYYSRGDNIIE